MAHFKRLPVESILIPERVQPLDDQYALTLQASIAEHGLISPIMVRRTPRGERPYTLVAGAHRLRAYQLSGEPWAREIEAAVIQAEDDDGLVVEIRESLHSGECSELDRAVLVACYQHVWEERTYGKLSPGNRVNITRLIAEQARSTARARGADIENGRDALLIIARLGPAHQVKLASLLREGLDPSEVVALSASGKLQRFLDE